MDDRFHFPTEEQRLTAALILQAGQDEGELEWEDLAELELAEEIIEATWAGEEMWEALDEN